MDAVSYTYARNNFSTTMEKVCNDHAPMIITRKNAEPVIMMSLEDYNAIMETAYLLGNPNNNSRLAESINQLENNEIVKPTDQDNI